jgi:hypothetical protein
MVIVLDALDFSLTDFWNLIVVDCMNAYTQQMIQPVYSMPDAFSLTGALRTRLTIGLSLRISEDFS